MKRMSFVLTVDHAVRVMPGTYTSFDAKHPIILSKGPAVTLLVRYTQEKQIHPGVDSMLAHLRTNISDF